MNEGDMVTPLHMNTHTVLSCNSWVDKLISKPSYLSMIAWVVTIISLVMRHKLNARSRWLEQRNGFQAIASSIWETPLSTLITVIRQMQRIPEKLVTPRYISIASIVKSGSTLKSNQLTYIVFILYFLFKAWEFLSSLRIKHGTNQPTNTHTQPAHWKM